MKKTGIMGGTFNPIHNGHIHLAGLALDAAGLDEVLWIPNSVAYLKDTSILVDPYERYRMVELAIEGEDRFCISDIEVRKGGNSYSHETIRELKTLEPKTEFYLITGADTLYTIESWVNPEYIFENVRFLAAYRSGQSIDDFNDQISHLENVYNAKIELISTEPFDISSTMLRDGIAAGEDVSEYIPAKVLEYIYKKGYYQKH